jgi:N-acetylneuraminic acid mutarotase
LEKRIILKKPSGLTRHTIIVYKDYIYLFGGSNGTTVNRLFYKMDLNTYIWEIIDYFD